MLEEGTNPEMLEEGPENERLEEGPQRLEEEPQDSKSTFNSKMFQRINFAMENTDYKGTERKF